MIKDRYDTKDEKNDREYKNKDDKNIGIHHFRFRIVFKLKNAGIVVNFLDRDAECFVVLIRNVF